MVLFPSRSHGIGAALGFLLILTAFSARGEEPAHDNPPLPLIEIEIDSPDAWGRLAGLDLDFVQVRPGYRARALGWPGSLDRIRSAGLRHRILHEDYGRALALRNGAVPAPVGSPAPASGVWNVPPMGQGSLAGFWTLEEIYAYLDSLVATDTLGLITGVDTIGTTIEGRPVLAVCVANTAQPLGTRPEVLFTSLTHAREPAGMQTILYFLGRLLEDYGTHPEITYLVDRRETWFVPVVNPDGYLYNQNEWFDTGAYGMWRKNLRQNDNAKKISNKDGVDINRNFGYQWGYDDIGSSPAITSPTYRGPTPFSEPETQNLRDFGNAHAFRVANNYHSYYELCLYPWAYRNIATPDSATFVRLGDALVEENDYGYGRSEQTLYRVNGDANDWMYGEQVTKPKTFAFTHEVGDQSDSFWPPPSRILPLARLNYRSNLVLAYSASVLLSAEAFRIDTGNGYLDPGEFAQASLRIDHIGVADNTTGGITVTVAPHGSEVLFVDDEARYGDLAPGESAWPLPGENLLVHSPVSTAPGELIPLRITFSSGDGFVLHDSVAFRVGTPIPVFADSGDTGLASWTSSGGTWGMQSVDGDSAFADSPDANYPASVDTRLTLNQPLDLSGAGHAVLRFQARWGFEGGYDFGRVEASIDSGATWTALAGSSTRPGHGTSGAYSGGTQPAGVPGYDGYQRYWVEEEVDLSAYAPLGDVRLRFRVTSDTGLQKDGFLLDDIRVLAWALPTPVAAEDAATPIPSLSVAAAPNPVDQRTRIFYSLPGAAPVRVSVFDVAGREVRVLSQGLAQAGDRSLTWDGRDATGRDVPAGTYFVRVESAGKAASSKLVVLN